MYFLIALCTWSITNFVPFAEWCKNRYSCNCWYNIMSLGNDPEYQAYVKKVPILLPLIPLYSVEKHKWLVG